MRDFTYDDVKHQKDKDVAQLLAQVSTISSRNWDQEKINSTQSPSPSSEIVNFDAERLKRFRKEKFFKRPMAEKENQSSSLDSVSSSNASLLTDQELQISSGSNIYMIRELPTSSGSTCLKIQELPTSSGSKSLKLQESPSSSGSKSLEFQELPTISGSNSLKFQEFPSCSGSKSFKIQESHTISGLKSLKCREFPSCCGSKRLKIQEFPSGSSGSKSLMIQEFPTSCGAKRLKNEENGSSSSAPKRRKMCDNQVRPPELPQHLKDMILGLAGGREESDPILVVQKQLYASDILSSKNRFMIPKKQMNPFLYEEEIASLPLEEVPIIEPNMNTGTVRLAKWKMGSDVLALIGNWGRIAKRNSLVVGMVMQLWAVRIDNKLWFVLVHVPGAIPQGCSNDDCETSEKNADRRH